MELSDISKSGSAALLLRLIVASPFDYMRQMRLFIVADMPDPAAAEFADSLEAGIRYFLRKTAGRAFVLFTNAALMRDMAGRLEPFCKSWICRFGARAGDVAECHAARFQRLAGRCCSVWIVFGWG